MFAKLKQKIAEEETSSDGNSSQPSSPQRRRKITTKARGINGYPENKWEQRRLSTASLYESKESVFSDLSSTSGYGSRRQSFTSRPTSLTPTWTTSDASNSSVSWSTWDTKVPSLSCIFNGMHGLAVTTTT